jgi:uncharacterized protein YecE (DUF72 family)
MGIRIGISGWRYAGWRGRFYPKGLRQASELAFASRAVQTIEINGTHYSLQSREAFSLWRDQTPPGFVFAIKGSRYLTHMLRFRDEAATGGLSNFFAQGILVLNEKIGPILWQFPPNFSFHAEQFEHFLSVLPRDTEAAASLAERHDGRVKDPCVVIDKKRRLRHAVEIRHDSFRDVAFVRLLRKYGVALVVSDTTEPWPCVEDVTAPFVYIRLHGTQTKYAGEYADDALHRWAQRVETWAAGSQPADARVIAAGLEPARRGSRDVYCYFDNDVKSQAPFDARRLMDRMGLSV